MIMAASWLIVSGCGGSDSHGSAAASNGDPPGVPSVASSDPAGVPDQCSSICQKTSTLNCPVTTDFATCANGCVLLLQAAAVFCPAQVNAYAGCLAAQPKENFGCAATGLFAPIAGVCTAEMDAMNRCGR